MGRDAFEGNKYSLGVLQGDAGMGTDLLFELGCGVGYTRVGLKLLCYMYVNLQLKEKDHSCLGKAFKKAPL